MRRFIIAGSLIALIAVGTISPAPAAASVYEVGAAARRVDPDAPGSPLPAGTAVRVGGNGFGNGSVVPAAAIGPGGMARDQGDHVSARAIVIGDGTSTVAFATVETQGMFAAYQRDIPGLRDIAEQVEAATGGLLPADNVTISNDHTHSGPDMIGAWGFVPDGYARFISEQVRDAILDAFAARVPATITAGADWVPDIIYNQTCTEALNQGSGDTYPNTVCDPFSESKDAWVRVLQARAVDGGAVVATMLAYAAHATLGGGAGLHGDWPQFVSERLTAEFGGVGLAFQGAVGRTQPCRPRCGFTDPKRPGYEIADRKGAYTTYLLTSARKALLGASPLSGPVKARKEFIRHEVSNPILLGATQHGTAIGAPIARSLDAPWTVGPTVWTPTSATRVGDLLILGAPGEAYPNIPATVAEATNTPWQRVWTLGLADDQLGYLIAPVEAWPAIAGQVAVNDNVIFNVSPTIGDHVTCAQIRAANAVGFASPAFRVQPRCAAWDAADSAS